MCRRSAIPARRSPSGSPAKATATGSVGAELDAVLYTPLVDFFRRDEVALDIRILAARGAIAPRALEQLALLMILTADRQPEVRETAEATIARLPVDVLSAFIARADVPEELRAFFVARGVPVAAAAAPDEPDVLVDTDDTDYGPDETADEDPQSVFTRIAAMAVPEKVKAAMKGSREMRSI